MKVFTSIEIDKLKETLESGLKLTRTQNIFYLNDKDIKKSNIVINYTQDEMLEYSKCYNDKIYFFEKYLEIKLFDFQKDMIRHYNENRFSIFMKSDQIGFLTIIAGLILHDLIFLKEQSVLYVDNKGKNTQEFIKKIKNLYKKLPFFIKPGVTQWNVKNISFDNFNRISIQSISKEPGISYTISTIILHNFAYVQPKIINNFYNSIIPTISYNSQSKIVIASAPNGNNLFYDLVQKSELRNSHPDKNMYETMKIYYHQIPGRGKEWKAHTIRLLGNDENAEILFAQRYELRIIGKREKKFKRILKILKE